MTFSDGMRLFKEKRYEYAANAFKEATEQNDQDHASWNGLGICLSKLGNYETAGICFDNALVIAPGKETYQKNRDKNAEKINKDEDLELDDDETPQVRLNNPKLTPYRTPSSVKSAQIPTMGFSYLQIAGGVIALFLLLMFMGACVASLGGSGSQIQVSSDVPYQPIPQVSEVKTATPTVEQTRDSVTMGQKNAARKALSYLSVLPYSRAGLIKQLVEFEKFSTDEAEYGVDKSGADWNEQAVKKAKSYLELMAFSRDGLIKQLVEFEQFTPAQAEYGVKSVGL